MNEEVKKILKPECYGVGHHGYPCPIPDWGACRKCGETAKKICQLFPRTKDNPDGYEPEPDEGGARGITDYSDEECCAYQRGYRHGSEAQRDLTRDEWRQKCEDLIAARHEVTSRGKDKAIEALNDKLMVAGYVSMGKEAEIAGLKEELRIGNSLTATLTDKCRELEAECQERVERIFKETEITLPMIKDLVRWEVLKKKECDG